MTDYQPRQYAKSGGLSEVDFRGMAASHDKSSIPNRDPTHASGGKRKRDDDAVRGACGGAPTHALTQCIAPCQEAEAMAVDAEAAGAVDPSDVQLPKRRAYDNVSGKVSGRPWKATFGRASSAAARPPSDWDAKMADKAKKKAIQARPPAARAPPARRGWRALSPAAADACAWPCGA